MAPSLGLYLDELKFKAYNEKQRVELQKIQRKGSQQKPTDSDEPKSIQDKESNETEDSQVHPFLKDKYDCICYVCTSMLINRTVMLILTDIWRGVGLGYGFCGARKAKDVSRDCSMATYHQTGMICNPFIIIS